MGRLQGGRLVGSDVALKRVLKGKLERPATAIRVFLFADVWADLLPFETHGRDNVASGPARLAREISFFAV